MATLAIDKLHARYVVDRPSTAARLDACLSRVVAEELDRALGEVDHPAEHVCVPRLAVSVRLDAGAPVAAAARTWAGAIAVELGRAIADGTGLVVYPHTLDALVDLVVSLGRGDRERAWAWHQVGLVRDAEVTDSDATVVAALVSRPELVPAVLVAAAMRGAIPLTLRGWVDVARAVQWPAMGTDRPMLPAGTFAGRLLEDGDAARPTPPTGSAVVARVEVDAVERVLRGPVARRLPDLAGLTSADWLALARLLVLCAAPAFVRRDAVVAALARVLAARRPATSGNPAAGAGTVAEPGRSIGPASTHPRAAGDAEDGRLAEAEFGGAHSGPAGDRAASPVVSAFGGVLFLFRVVAVLDLVEEAGVSGSPPAGRPFGWVASSLAQRLAGAAPDDPAVSVLAGPQDPDNPPPFATAAEDAALTALADRIEAWLRLRLDPAENLDWLWRRRATVVAEPGWIEAVFALDDVDTRIRQAGLDLDPGFVWWLGAVVKFRYV